jgi:DNA-binding beta-propeller fold protein YncE
MRVKTMMACLACALLLPFAAAPAHAERALLSEKLLQTEFKPPPPEGEIEGACGLAVSPSPGSSLYVSDYYHRVVDLFSLGGTYQSQIVLAGKNPVFGINTLDAVCGLAFDSSGNLYANEFHEKVLRLKPSPAMIDEGESTGVAVDGAGNLYVNDRTYVAKYEAPVDAGDEPVAKIGLGTLEDGYGLAVFGGKVYAPDAASDTIKVYESSGNPLELKGTIAHGFTSLADAAVAVDPTNGHLLVVDNPQPGFEHPKSAIYEFDASGAFLGQLPGAPVFGEPSGIAVDPATGNLFVSDGNTELSNVFAYGPYAEAAPLAPSPPGGGGSSSGASLDGSGPETAPTAAAEPHPRSRPASTSVAVQRGPVRVSVDGKLTPHDLPRHGAAPVGIAVAARIVGTGKGAPPQLRRIAIAINRNGHFTPAGLPLCRVHEIQPSTTAGALAACRDALVGEGHFSANVKLPEQSPFPSQGEVVAFNGRLHGRPAILAHIYGTQPAPTSYVLPFLIRSSHGTYGNVLEASLPQATGDWGYVTGLRMTLRRRFSYRGARRSYLSAGCPAPSGFPGAVFPLARTSFVFAGGMTLASVLDRSCRAKG